MPQDEKPGLRKRRMEYDAALDSGDEERIETARRALERQERHARGEDAITGRPLRPEDEPSLQKRVRERRRTERELGIRRGRP
jgi:hypothetical protein